MSRSTNDRSGQALVESLLGIGTGSALVCGWLCWLFLAFERTQCHRSAFEKARARIETQARDISLLFPCPQGIAPARVALPNIHRILGSEE